MPPNPQWYCLSEKVKSHITMNLCKGEQVMGEEVNMAIIQLNGEKQNFILDKKNFKTGSKGFYGMGKMVSGGKRYQVQIQCVEIGSKPKEK